MKTLATNDTSVILSLAELSALETSRVEEEEAELRRRIEAERRDREEAAKRAREAEAARLAEESAARAKKVFDEAAELARIDARERADAEVRRIEAEGRARIAAEDVARAHELRIVKERSQSDAGTWKLATFVVLGLAVALGTGGALFASARGAELRREVAEAHAEAGAMAARAHDAKVERERLVEASRAASAVRSVERVASSDAAADVVTAWANEKNRGDLVALVTSAKALAKKTSSDGDARAYEASIEAATKALSSPKVAAGAHVPSTGVHTVTTSAGSACADSHDPMCGLDGRTH